MTKTELLTLLGELEVHPSRALGQNFLIDANLLDWTVRTAAPCAGEPLLEIGAGTGVLTARLLDAGAQVLAVEIDRRLAAYLRRRFADNPNLRLVEGDACDLDYDTHLGAAPYRCIANLPYAVSSVVIAHLLELRNPPRELFVLLQVEMAERLQAGPGSKAYGALSVLVQLDYQVKILRRVSPAVFFPAPEVGSAYVRFQRRPEPVSPGLRRQVRTLARLGFGQRRKQFRKLLCAQFAVTAVTAAFARLGLPADVRAEALPVETFKALAAALETADARGLAHAPEYLQTS